MPADKEQIADEFQRQVERFGFGRASVEDVAAQLGISKRTIYQHFSSKKDLYAYVVDRIGRAEEARLRAALPPSGSARERMEWFLNTVIGGMRTHIEQTSKADWMQEFEIAYDAMAGAYGSVGTEIVREGNESGEFEFADAELANGFIGAMVTHYGVLVRDEPGYNADSAVVAAIMRMLGGRGPAERGGSE